MREPYDNHSIPEQNEKNTMQVILHGIFFHFRYLIAVLIKNSAFVGLPFILSHGNG